ncbi:MAG: hypothetical protein RL598_718, partial [Verrucomicrobiota bacterium]
AHFRLETALAQTELAGSHAQSGIKVISDVERKVHWLIQELCLVLSKKDFGGAKGGCGLGVN